MREDSQYLSVSDFNTKLKGLMEAGFSEVYVKGEISELKHHQNGHIYFTLKDAKSSISCVIWRSQVGRMKDIDALILGAHLCVSGALSLWVEGGRYSLVVRGVKREGLGDIYTRFLELKKRLNEQGYFERHAPLPPFIKNLAIITSSTSAALMDIKRVAKMRYPLAKLTIYDATMQGANASASIIATLDRIYERLEKEPGLYDALLISRGGGSMEDLNAFNDEAIALKAFSAPLPLISAIGHESDTVILDFIADLRAPTPSAAIEMILPDVNSLLSTLASMEQNASYYLERLLEAKAKELVALKEGLFYRLKGDMFEGKKYLLDMLRDRLEAVVDTRCDPMMLETLRLRLDAGYKEYLDANSAMLRELDLALHAILPVNDTYAQPTIDGVPVSVEALGSGMLFTLSNLRASIEARVL